MNSDPQKRLNAIAVRINVNNWLNKIASSDDNEIKKQFLDADKVTKSSPISSILMKCILAKLIVRN